MHQLSSRFLDVLDTSTQGFREKARSEITNRDYRIESPSDDREVNVTTRKIENALRIVCPSNIASLKGDVIRHFEEVRSFIPFCSSPKSFRTAWDLRSKLLSPWDANTLVDQGGQLIPENNRSRIFQCIQQGVELGKNKRLILAVRHSEGNYEDKMDDLGRFTYQPPNNATGMLRYRWCQFLSKSMKIPYILLAVMWFGFHQPIKEELKRIFVLAPAKIIDYEEDLNNIANSLSHPLQLQLINRTEALSTLNRLFSLDETSLEIETRDELPEQLAREWSYDKINSTEKGRRIKRWAQRNGKRCPGTMCNNENSPHIEFRDLSRSQISFGHIVPKNWAKAFTYMLDKIDHPDNLYLTCKSCNSSLGDAFPARTLRDNIVAPEFGTIGDWLRKNEEEIRES